MLFAALIQIRIESDNDVLYADKHDSTVEQASRRNNWLTPTAGDTCGERCAQLDDFNWVLPSDVQAGDLPAPEQMDTRAQQLLCPPVVTQTRPMEGCGPALPRRLRRGHYVLTEDGVVAGGYRMGVRSF